MGNFANSPLHCLHAGIRFVRFVGVFVTASLLLLSGLQPQAVAWCQSGEDGQAEAKQAEVPAETPSAEQLFQDLESDRFLVREEATTELAKLGADVLPKIAERYFTAPPETIYRIRKILEGVGSSGDEPTFLRATSLLLTLYSNGNEEMVQRIELLKADWRKRRKDNAVQAILANGGEVVSEYNTSVNLQLRQVMVNRTIQQSITDQATTGRSATQKKLDVGQQRELVDKIMTNSADENRDFILEHSKANSSSKPKPTQYSYSVPQPLSVRFPDGWVADESVLAKLSELDGPVALELGAVAAMNDEHWRILKNTDAIVSVDTSTIALPGSAALAFPLGIRVITLRNYSLEPDFCRSLGQFSSLGVLQLSNCNLNADSVAALNQLKRVSTIPVSFRNKKVDADSISALARLKRVRAIEMENAQVSTAALAELEKLPQISGLKVASMSINAEFLKSVGRMKRLTQFELRGCEFDVDAFKGLESTRRIRIEFQPKAFLGVGPQGGGRPDSIGCQIAYIAPGSSAAREGIRVGDVIRAIDGDPVKTFHEVRLKIAQFDPGEKMTMKIQRAEEMLELEVELGKNPSSVR